MFEMSPSIILTLDILGFSNLVREAKRKADQDRLLNKILKASQEVKTLYGILSPANATGGNNCKVKFYTDNFIASLSFNPELPSDKKDRLNDMILYAAIHQWRFAQVGLFVRGSITAGLNYMDENVVFGKAMIHGHELEACVAKYPRIILDNALLPLIDFLDDNLYIDEDDGRCFINYLTMASHNGKSISKYLNDHKKFITKNIEKYSATPSIRDKYAWLARYHNFFCSNFCESSPELKISSITTERFSNISWERLQKLLR